MAIGVSQAFKDAMQAPVKVIQATIVADEQTFTSADYLTNLSIEASGYYFGTTTKALEFNLLGTTYDLLNKAINVSISVQTDAANDTWEHCNLGNFYVYEQEVKMEKETTTFKAYDKVGMMAKEYYTGGGFTFPCTVSNLVEQFESKFGLHFTPETLVNGNYQITEDLYAKINNITYRDILAELAGATASIVNIGGVGNTMTFRETPRTAIETWTYDNLKSIKLEPKYGTINAVTLSRAPEEDNISAIDEPVVQDEGTELEFEDVSRFKSVTLKGESEQATTTGKQLVQYNDTFVAGNNHATGITPTILSDGTLQVVVASGNGNWHTQWWNTSQTFDSIEDTLANGDTFTIAFTIKKTSGSTGVPKIYMKDSMGYKQMLGTIGTDEYSQIYYTGTWNDTGGIRIHIGWGDCTGTFIIKNWMINKGTQVPYEKYTGGIPAPNPDYPQAVQVVTGEQIVSISGKNLQDVSSYEDKYINANGGLVNGGGTNALLDYVKVESGVDYTVSVSESSGISSTQFAFFDSNKGFVTRDILYNQPNRTITIPAGCEYLRMWVYRGSGWTQETLENSHIQLEKGSATEFEPYSHQEYEVNLGKNLFDKNNIKILNGYFEYSGDTIHTSSGNRVFYIPCEPNTQYSFTQGATSVSTHVFQVATTTELPTIGTAVYGFFEANRDNVQNYLTSANARYIVVRIRAGDDVSTFWDGIQIEEGSVVTSYAPYISHFGKNLFGTEIVVGGIGSAGTPLNRNDRFNTLNKIQVTPNTTYTFSATPKDSSKPLDVVFQAYDSSGAIISQLPGDYFSRLPLTFTTPQNCTQITMSGRYWDNTVIGTVGNVTDVAQNIQLELGSTASPYQPFIGGQIQLSKIGNYQDYIYKNGDDWYVHKETATSTLDGTESWSYASGSQKYFYTNSISAASLGAAPSTGGLCTHYIYDSSRLSAHGFNYGNAWFFQIMNADYTDATNFKSWLSQNKPVFYYPLATPTDTQITNEDLIAQLNAVLEAELPSKTNFVTSSGNLTAYLDIEAYEKVDVKEIKLANNEILDDNRESTILPILNSVSGFEFYPFEATTEGHGWHECGDRIAVTDGTNTWDVVISYIKLTIDGGIKETIKGVRPTESQTNYALAGGIMKTIYNTEIKVDKQGQEITSIVSRQDSFENQTLDNFSQVVQNINSVTTTIQTTGGGNLLHNSVGYNVNTDKTLKNWTQSGTVSSESSPESVSYGAISGNQIDLGASSSITQRITVDNSGSQLYTLGFKVKKSATGVVTVHLRNNIDDYTVSIPEGSAILWKGYSIVGVAPHASYFDVVIETNNAVSSLAITDMMLSVGDTTIPWVSASDEILSKNVAVDSSGVTVRSSATNDYTQLNELGLNGYSDASGSMENVFTVNRDTTEVSKLKARKQISMPPIKIVPVTSGNRAGWGFVKGE